MLQNNITEIFDSSRKKWKVVSGGPSLSDYGILSFSKLGVYIFGGFNTFHVQDIHRFYEGKNVEFHLDGFQSSGNRAICESEPSRS